MNKLRIAMLMSSNPLLTGGVQEHIFHLSKELRKNGHTVMIFGPRSKKNRFINYRALGEKVYFPLPNGTQSNVHLLGLDEKPENIFTPSRFDVLHIHEPYIPFAAWTALEKSTVPTVGTFHTAWDNESLFNVFNSFIPLFKDRFSSFNHGAIFVSKITSEKWKSMCNRSVIKQIIPNAVDTTLFHPKKTINKVVKLLFVARIVHRKGLMPLLRALTLLTAKKIHYSLTVIGDGDEKDQAIRYCKEKKLSRYVSFLGEIKGRQRARYFTQADIFCAPYVNEAASISVLEAVSSGLPVVGYNIPVFSDLLKDYPGKSLLTKKTDEALANGLIHVINHPDEIGMIKNWCINKRETFSWATIARQTQNHYYQVIEKHAKRTS